MAKRESRLVKCKFDRFVGKCLASRWDLLECTPEWRTSSAQYYTRPTAGAASPILAILNWIVANKGNFDNSGFLNRYLKEFAGKSTDIERSEPL